MSTPQSLWLFVERFRNPNYSVENFKADLDIDPSELPESEKLYYFDDKGGKLNLINVRDGLGNSLLDHADFRGREDLVDFLIAQGASPIATASVISEKQNQPQMQHGA
jgi:ankyrin repeat protein